MSRPGATTVVLGAGLAGLAAGVGLARAGRPLLVLEGDCAVGGLARTVVHGAFRFDLGGHRLRASHPGLEAFVEDLLGEELVSVARRSTIVLAGRSLDYPLKPLNAVFGLGLARSGRILLDYAGQQLRGRLRSAPLVSLEDWVVSRFGRTMFRMYFEGYSEKVWGIDCRQISMDWVERRIQGLSLGLAIRRALFGWPGRSLPTLAEEFRYPRLGAGRIAERMRQEIEPAGPVFTSAPVERIEHRDFRVERVRAGGRVGVVEGEDFVATIPLPALVAMLDPPAPAAVLAAARRLRYRDLVVVALMLDRPRVTDQSWIYVPDRGIPFSRVHEPTNWSPLMAPPGQTLLVTEHLCFAGDRVWRASDAALADVTADHLARLGLLRRPEIVDCAVVRVPRAYPILAVGYRDPCARIQAYLGRFENLHLAGRTGTFAYLDMDHAIAAGLGAARRVVGGRAADGDRPGDALALTGADA